MSTKGLLGSIGNMLGGQPDRYANAIGVSSYPTLPNNADMWSNQITGQTINTRELETRKMVSEGDIIVRKVRNGYRIMVVSGYNQPGMLGAPLVTEDYVARDMDEVHDVIKLASVNSRLDAAK